MNNSIIKNISAVILTLFFVGASFAQQPTTYVNLSKRQSARSDKLTGGAIERAALQAGAGALKITVNVPAFQLTLWQNGKEIKTYPVGVGMKEFPIYIGDRAASAVIWNPAWIPPDSDWVKTHKGVKVGEIIKPTDPRNPIGKMKIPLGDGFLIHQAKGVGDLGSLVSHGCVRMLKADLFDLGEKIAAANALPVTARQIADAKVNLKTLTAEIEPAIPVEITYDTEVVEAGRLHIYPDVYDRGANTVANLRDELATNGIDAASFSDETLQEMLAKATAKKQYVIAVENLKSSKMTAAQILPVIRRSEKLKTKN